MTSPPLSTGVSFPQAPSKTARSRQSHRSNKDNECPHFMDVLNLCFRAVCVISCVSEFMGVLNFSVAIKFVGTPVQAGCRLAYASTSHFAPDVSKLTWMRAWLPRPSRFSTVPSPKRSCTTRWPGPKGVSASGSALLKKSRVTAPPRRMSSMSSAGISPRSATVADRIRFRACAGAGRNSGSASCAPG